MSTADLASSHAAAAVAAEEAIVRRLGLGLDAVHRAHDLGRDELVATERGIGRLAQQSMAPPANEFWETTAVPRAHRLVTEAGIVINRALLSLAQHRCSLCSDRHCSDRHWAVAEADVLAVISRAEQIDELGRWWQRRLRRTATLRSIPTVLTRVPAQVELTISTMEMDLLDRAPWSHSDRLLSAFELAHGELARYGRRRVAELYQG